MFRITFKTEYIFRTGKCRSCDVIVAWSRDRVASHKRKSCKTAPREHKDFFAGLLCKTVEVVEVSQVAPLGRTRSQNKSKEAPSSSSQERSTSKLSVDKYVDKINMKDAEILDSLFSDFMYRCGIPFTVADSQTLKSFVTRLKPAYQLPTSFRLRTTLLDKKYLLLKGKSNEYLSDAKDFVLISDGWSNIQKQHLVNFIVQVPGKKPFFHKCLNTSAIEMNADNVTKMIVETATEIGIDKWAGLITDTAPVMQKVWKLVEKDHPLVFANGCGAHVVNLIIKRICLSPGPEALLQKCGKVIKFINNHTRLYSTFVECQKIFKQQHALQMSVPTRFYTQHTSAKSVLANKNPISLLFEDHEDVIEVTAKKDVRSEVKSIINDIEFWKDLKVFTDDLLQPFVTMISNLEADSTSLEEVYANFMKIKSHFENVTLNECFDKELITDEIKYYWGHIHTESMGFAFILSPKNLHRLDDMDSNDYEDTVSRLEQYIDKFYETSPDLSSLATQQLHKFFVDYEQLSKEKQVRMLK